MKSLILAALVAMTVGLFGASPSSAAPANGVTIGQAADVSGLVQDVQYRRHWRGERRYFRRGPACRTVRVCGRYRCTWVRRCY